MISSVPQNARAEAAVLASILLDPDLALPRAVAVLTAPDFFSGSNRAIWEGMMRILGRGEPVDILTLEAELRDSGNLPRAGGIKALAELAGQVPTGENITHHARLVRSDAVRRSLMALGEDLTRKAAQGAPEELIQASLSELASLLGSEQGGRNAAEVAEAVVKGWEEQRTQGTVPGVKTSLSTLNAALEAGGWARGVLTVVAGQTSMGKTSLLVGEALEAALAGHRVDYVGLEDKAERIFKRMVASRASLHNQQLQGMGPKDGEWRSAMAAVGEIANLKEKLHFWSQKDGNARKLAAKVLARQRAKGTDLVFWDYLQKTRGGQGNSLYERTTDTYKVIDGLSGDMPDTALVLASQFKRVQDLGKPPGLNDLKGSGEIENEARSVLIIWTHPRLKDEPFRLLRIAKQSDGSRPDVYVRWTADHVRFEDANDFQQSQFRERIKGAIRS